MIASTPATRKKEGALLWLFRVLWRNGWKRKIFLVLIATTGVVTVRRLLHRWRLKQALSLMSPPPEVTRPEDASLDSEILENMVEGIYKKYIESGILPGAVLILVRKGRLVFFEILGEEYNEHTIFRLYSLTNIFTSMAILQRFERGDLKMGDKLTQFINLPPFVVQRGREEPWQTNKVPSLRQLLTHTSGFSCCFPWVHPPSRARPAELNRAAYLRDDVERVDDLDEVVAQETAVPLLFEPGDHFNMSCSYVILGKVIEAATGLSVDEYLSQYLFQPLRMCSTGFAVAEDDKIRIAQEHWYPETARVLPDFFGGVKGVLLKFFIALQVPFAYVSGRKYIVAMKALGELLWGDKYIPNADTGLYSTATDMVQLLKMITNWGRLPDDAGADLGIGEGSRVLSEEALRSAFVGHTHELVPPYALDARPEKETKPSIYGCQAAHVESTGEYREFNSYPGQSFCLGSFRVIDDPKKSGLPPRARGTIHMSGAASTYMFINPFEGLGGCILSQVCDERSNSVFQDFVKECHRSL